PEIAPGAALEDTAPERLDAFEDRAGLYGGVALGAGAVAEERDHALIEVAGRERQATGLLVVLTRKVAAGPHAGETIAFEGAVLAGEVDVKARHHGVGPGVADEHGHGEVADVVDRPGHGVLVVGDEVAVGAVPDAGAVERRIRRERWARWVRTRRGVRLQAAGHCRVGMAEG